MTGTVSYDYWNESQKKKVTTESDFGSAGINTGRHTRDKKSVSKSHTVNKKNDQNLSLDDSQSEDDGFGEPQEPVLVRNSSGTVTRADLMKKKYYANFRGKEWGRNQF